MHTHSWYHTKSGWGDAAVDGLLSGVVAGMLMAIFLLVVGWIGGLNPNSRAGSDTTAK